MGRRKKRGRRECIGEDILKYNVYTQNTLIYILVIEEHVAHCTVETRGQSSGDASLPPPLPPPDGSWGQVSDCQVWLQALLTTETSLQTRQKNSYRAELPTPSTLLSTPTLS